MTLESREQRWAQPLVRRNDWSVLVPPALGQWTPTLSVSVVIPTYAAETTLPTVLAGLAAQTYPAHLLQVVVVDDGNSPPVTLPPLCPDNTLLVRVESGWGRANACHEGAMAADGEIIHWLDSDMLAFAEEVEAQARWHHLIDYAVVLGTKRFVDPAVAVALPPAEVRSLVASGEVASLYDWDNEEPHKWVENMWKRTSELTQAGPRAFRAHVGATGSLTRSLYLSAGGMDTSLPLGEDMEIGHRLAEAGGVLIPDHAARSWHLGRTHVMQHRDDINRHNDSFLANLVPGMRPKRNKRGRIYDIPYLEVVVPTGAASQEVLGCVDSILDSSLDDLSVVVLGEWSSLSEERRSVLADPLIDLRIIERTYRSDPRVSLFADLPTGRCRAPWRLTLDSTAWAPLPGALEAVIDDLDRTHEGLRIIPGVGRLERTSAVSRAALLGVSRAGAGSGGSGSAGARGGQEIDAALDRALDATFGAQTLAPAEAGFVPTSEREVPRYEGKLRPPVPPFRSRERLASELDQGRAGP